MSNLEWRDRMEKMKLECWIKEVKEEIKELKRIGKRRWLKDKEYDKPAITIIPTAGYSAPPATQHLLRQPLPPTASYSPLAKSSSDSTISLIPDAVTTSVLHLWPVGSSVFPISDVYRRVSLVSVHQPRFTATPSDLLHFFKLLHIIFAI
ncbi:ARM repeat superfamily protein [Striga asiatica]|uniref:ARM repeat superfamily protein n=1 Tax=Striga asiatica TaxID=4170 RepID=A0A5A7R2Y3_STRAF|nr:ARM repeat superfamily protein [Striga asiatica]